MLEHILQGYEASGFKDLGEFGFAIYQLRQSGEVALVDPDFASELLQTDWARFNELRVSLRTAGVGMEENGARRFSMSTTGVCVIEAEFLDTLSLLNVLCGKAVRGARPEIERSEFEPFLQVSGAIPFVRPLSSALIRNTDAKQRGAALKLAGSVLGLTWLDENECRRIVDEGKREDDSGVSWLASLPQ